MEYYHVNTNGWATIAQHVTLFPDGMWVLGRDFNTTPASITGWNTGAFCIEMIGNFDTGCDVFKNPQADAMYEFCEYMVEQKALMMRFHRDSPTAYKTCPGSGIDRATFFNKVANFTEDKLAKAAIDAGIVRQQAEKDAALKRVEELKKVMSKAKVLFTDMINPNGQVHYANDYVNLLANKNIVKGIDNGDGTFSFHPDQPINRADVCVLIAKALESLEEEIKAAITKV